jgi:hypothetical protein
MGEWGDKSHLAFAAIIAAVVVGVCSIQLLCVWDGSYDPIPAHEKTPPVARQSTPLMSATMKTPQFFSAASIATTESDYGAFNTTNQRPRGPI